MVISWNGLEEETNKPITHLIQQQRWSSFFCLEKKIPEQVELVDKKACNQRISAKNREGHEPGDLKRLEDKFWKRKRLGTNEPLRRTKAARRSISKRRQARKKVKINAISLAWKHALQAATVHGCKETQRTTRNAKRTSKIRQTREKHGRERHKKRPQSVVLLDLPPISRETLASYPGANSSWDCLCLPWSPRLLVVDRLLPHSS